MTTKLLLHCSNSRSGIIGWFSFVFLQSLITDLIKSIGYPASKYFFVTSKYFAVYPIGFIKLINVDFNKKDEKQLVIPDWLFEEPGKFSYKLPYYPSNEHGVRSF